MQTIRDIVRVASLRYDDARGAFEARVDVEREGRTFRYPVSLAAAPSADRDWVEAMLAQAALRQSDTARFDRARPGRMSARRPAAPFGVAAWLQSLRPTERPRAH